MSFRPPELVIDPKKPFKDDTLHPPRRKRNDVSDAENGESAEPDDLQKALEESDAYQPNAMQKFVNAAISILRLGGIAGAISCFLVIDSQLYIRAVSAFLVLASVRYAVSWMGMYAAWTLTAVRKRDLRAALRWLYADPNNVPSIRSRITSPLRTQERTLREIHTSLTRLAKSQTDALQERRRDRRQLHDDITTLREALESLND